MSTATYERLRAFAEQHHPWLEGKHVNVPTFVCSSIRVALDEIDRRRKASEARKQLFSKMNNEIADLRKQLAAANERAQSACAKWRELYYKGKEDIKTLEADNQRLADERADLIRSRDDYKGRYEAEAQRVRELGVELNKPRAVYLVYAVIAGTAERVVMQACSSPESAEAFVKRCTEPGYDDFDGREMPSAAKTLRIDHIYIQPIAVQR